MKKNVFLGTTNVGKIERYKRLLLQAGAGVDVFAPADFGLNNIEVEETGKTLAENAELRVRAYFGKVDMPILANDTGFWVAGEGLVVAPKRTALQETARRGESVAAKMSKDEVSAVMVTFWQDIARKHGGKVDAAWIEAFAMLDPDGRMHRAETRRNVVLTDQIMGDVHPELPVRALYIAKATGKPAAQHTPEEELLEMRPLIDALAVFLRE